MNPLPAATRMGRVDLSVANLPRSLEYYTRSIGLRVLSESDSEAILGAGSTELLRLVEEPGARPADGYSGLFHFALLVPERAELGRWLAHARREQITLTGASDHNVSEALYLRDPDHHGIEIYSDRPRELWEGRVDALMGTAPLDLNDLLRAANGDEFDRLADGTTMGHVHLRISDVEQAERFYNDDVGFDVVARYGNQAAFLSAGGYHHHLAANTWETLGAAQAPEWTARLLSFAIVVPGLDSAEARQDPSGNTLVLQPGG